MRGPAATLGVRAQTASETSGASVPSYRGAARSGPPGPIDGPAPPLTSSIRRRLAMLSVIAHGQDLGLLMGQPRQLLGLEQMGDAAMEAPFRYQLVPRRSWAALVPAAC
jgi:hypothetical protein